MCVHVSDQKWKAMTSLKTRNTILMDGRIKNYYFWTLKVFLSHFDQNQELYT